MYEKKSNIEKKEILFGDFVFRKGINVTVRKGVKWHGAKGAFMARPTKKESYEKAVVEIGILETAIYLFRDLKAKVIDFEHDRRARTYSGLLKGMREAYGEDFSENEYVTVVFFKRKGKQEDKKCKK